MATRASLETKIAAFTDGGENTAAEFRAYATELLNDVYPTPITETGTGSDVNTILLAASSYTAEVTLTKIGRRVFVEGWLRNITGTSVSSANILEFLTDEFIPTDANISGLPTMARSTGKTPNGTLCDIAIGWAVVGGEPTPILRVETLFAPNTSPTSKYYFQMSYNVKL